MSWDKDAAAESGKLAKENLVQIFQGMTPEEKAGMAKFIGWWSRWYNGNTDEDGITHHATGHNALGKIFWGVRSRL